MDLSLRPPPCPFWRSVAERRSNSGVRWLELRTVVRVLPKLAPLRWLRRGDSQVTITLLGEDSPLPRRFLLNRDLFNGDGLSTSKDNFDDIFSLGIILTSVGLGGGDLSLGFSPKYGQVQGGGSGKEMFSHASDLPPMSEHDERVSWKLDPLLLQRGDGLSSLLSPSWNVDALRRFKSQGDVSADRSVECDPDRFSPELKQTKQQ